MTADKTADKTADNKPAAKRASTTRRRFKAEVRKVLELVIGSLYTHKEIFLRELISNASDALEKLRFEALREEDLYEGESTLSIRIEYDAGRRTLAVIDNGIGMAREEIADHLGTIAGSGTRHLLESLEQGKDAPELIGRFGVGFYAAFMVADKVVVESRRAGVSRSEGVRWSSTGEGGYSIENVDRPKRGTRVTLYLKEGADEYLDETRLRAIVHRYSDYVNFPILMPASEGGGEEQVNRATAIWTVPRKNLSEREYHEFYRHLSHELGEPLCYVHSRVEGKAEYICLLYVPAESPLLPHEQWQHRSVRLYVRRVFIMDQAEAFLPTWLRFVRGVIDSEGLPLNVSRETLQTNSEVETIRRGCTRKVLDALRRLADEEPEKYTRFWGNYGAVLKEGALEDSPFRSDVIELFRFYSTNDAEADNPGVSLADYAARMLADQKEIYCLTADNLDAARRSPHLEAFAGKAREVLLMTDPIDEWLVMRMPPYRDYPLRLITHGDLELPGDKEAAAKSSPADTELTAHVTKALGKQVREVRMSSRLTESAACLVYGEREPSDRMRRLLEAGGRSLPAIAPVLALNPRHPLVRQAQAAAPDSGRFTDLAHLLLDQARLNEGVLPPDPAGFVRTMNRILTGAPSSEKVASSADKDDNAARETGRGGPDAVADNGGNQAANEATGDGSSRFQ